MGIKTFNPYTPSRRQMTALDKKEITKKTPEKSLLSVNKKNAGRNNQGKITVRHQGGGTRRQYRIIDSREIRMVSRQKLQESNTIRTEQQILHC